jgi:hypothetical protein
MRADAQRRIMHQLAGSSGGGWANWATLTGALCFAIGGVMQGFDRPSTAR